MTQSSFHVRTLGLLLALGLAVPQEPELLSAELTQAKVAAFDLYVKATEARIDAELERPGAFLYADGLPESKRATALAALKRGEIYMERMQARDASGHEMEAPNALIHHWMGAVFVPCATLKEAVELVQDYDRHQDIYKPEVLRSKLVSHNGNDFKIFYRL